MKKAPENNRYTVMSIGLIFILLGILCNENAIASLFAREGKISSITLRILIYIFQGSLLVTGISAITLREKTVVFKFILGAFIFQLCVLALFFIAEIQLRTKHVEKRSADPYEGFYKQHLHPFYYFFFPQDGKALEQINNDIVSIDRHGFRGEGPEKRGEKKLAFIVGGSAVFGIDTPSDQTTISGWLNKLQREYHFVNAGVPSWNSLQEFYRISLELVDYEPSLIVAYDGFNDMILANENDHLGYPAGTPESYNNLEEWVNDIRGAKKMGPFLINRRYDFDPFEQTDILLKRLTGSKSSSPKNSSGKSGSDTPNRSLPEYYQNSTHRYLKNLELMNKICESYRCNFIAIWQPALALHKEPLSKSFSSGEEEKEYFRLFHKDVLEKRNRYSLSFYDLGNMLDDYKGPIQTKNAFIDRVHLNEEGNKIAALEIIKILEKEGLMDAAKK